MSRREPPCCDQAIKWLIQKEGRGYLAPLTGQDSSALRAFAHLLELYGRGDHFGQRYAERAMADVVLAMQPQCRSFAKEMIPAVLDWSDVDRIWAAIEQLNAMAMAPRPRERGDA